MSKSFSRSYAVRRLKQFRDSHEFTPEQRSELNRIIWLFEQEYIEQDEAFEQTRMWAIRNPGFEGDEMGRPDDDFDDPPTLNGREKEDDEE